MTPKNFNDPNDQQDRQRMVVAVVVSLLILFGFHYFVDRPRQEELARQRATQQETTATAVKAGAPASAPKTSEPVSRDKALASSGRVEIKGHKIAGSLALKGARLDDILLLDHFTTVEKKDNVALLTPAGAQGAFYVESGWLPAGNTTARLPDANTVWSVSSAGAKTIESGGDAVVLRWDNGQGLSFEREISLDDNYLFTVKQRVRNNTGAPVTLSAYHLTSRIGLPSDFSGFFVLHEGPVGFFGGEGHEPSYKDVQGGDKIEQAGVTGWLGITDKYWMTALLPDPKTAFDARITGSADASGKHTQADAVMAAVTVAAGDTATDTSYVYAGVKDVDVMRAYQTQYGFSNLEYGIDFGMWYFITKPFFFLLHLLADMAGSIAAAILLMTVIVRGAVFPLASKSFTSMAKMRIVAPKLKELQEKHKEDKATLQMEIFELYKRESVNPFSGCWPILIQIPIFFALYKVILISVELRHAPFWGWVQDLSAPDPTSLFNLFGLLPFTPPQPLMIGAWPVLFCISMIVQKRISPPMTDPVQEKIQSYFPYVVTVMLAHFSVGLVIYWTWSNVLGILQQYYILKKVGGEDTSLLRGHAQRRKKKGDK